MNNISLIGRDCCGCGSCASACPLRCIDMRADREGFFFPAADEAVCVGCGKCLAACPIHSPRAGSEPAETYAARATDDETLSRSSSGGLFSLAARETLSAGGVVYGAALDEEEREVRLVCAQNETRLPPLCGSKYVQSQPLGVYKEIEAFLAAGRPVLFSGCPCQVAALKSFLGGDRDKLTTLDIICHGTPSPALFKAYMAWLEKREKAKITRYRFRTKQRGWSMTVGYLAGGKERFRASVFDRYGNPFQARKNYRESCYACPFAAKARQGDLTIGDYWGVLSEHPAFYSPKGVSMLMVNTKKGARMLEAIKPMMRLTPSTFEQMARHNENLLRPSERPNARGTFYQGFNGSGDVSFVQRRMKPEIKPQAAIKALVPWRLKQLIQRLKGGKV